MHLLAPHQRPRCLDTDRLSALLSRPPSEERCPRQDGLKGISREAITHCLRNHGHRNGRTPRASTRIRMARATPPSKALSRIIDQPGDASAWPSCRPIALSQNAMQANPTDERTRGEVVRAAKPYAINSVEVFECQRSLVLPLRTQ